MSKVDPHLLLRPPASDYSVVRKWFRHWFGDLDTRYPDINRANEELLLLLPAQHRKMVELRIEVPPQRVPEDERDLPATRRVWFTWNRVIRAETKRLKRERRVLPGTWVQATQGDVWIMHLWTEGTVPASIYVPEVARWLRESGAAVPGELIRWFRDPRYREDRRGRFGSAILPRN